MTRTLLLIMGLALAVPGAASAQSFFAGPRPPALLTPPPGVSPESCANAGFARQAEALIAWRIDAERAKFAPGAPPLRPDLDLTRVAQLRSCDMAQGIRDFSHRDSRGRFIAGDMVRERLGPYGMVGENIMEESGMRSFRADEFARVAVEGWMESPGHRANILNPRFDSSGIGVAMAGDQVFATQVFYGPPRDHGE